MDAEKMEYLENDEIVQEIAMKAAETADSFIFEVVLPFCQENYQGELKKEDLRRALGLLKAQEPRVLTLEEVKALPVESDVWVEITGAKGSKPRITATTIHGNGEKEIFGWLNVFNFAAYGKEIYGWRCWTARPTEEQRKAVAWDGQEQDGAGRAAGGAACAVPADE